MYRWIYVILSPLLVLGAYYMHDTVIGVSDNLNSFSYFGTVLTAIGLFITVFEVLHAISTTKSLQSQTLIVLKQVQAIESASSISDCIAAIDLVSGDVNDEKYVTALANFQHMRKLCVKVIPTFCMQDDDEKTGLSTLGVVERSLLSMARSESGNLVSKRQKDDVLKKILLIKQEIEQNNPAKRS